MADRTEPASLAQRMLWMIRHYRSDLGALNCPLLCSLDGDLDPVALGRALDGLVARHEALRTTFQGRGARLTQRIAAPGPVPVRVVDLRGADDPAAALATATAAELQTPIDPLVSPIRVVLWRVTDTRHVLCVNLHHLVTDAWSTGVLLRDLAQLYAGGSPPLPPEWQYAEFAAWQREQLSGDRLNRYRDYWRRQLAGGQLPRLDALGPPGAGSAGTAVHGEDVPPAVVAGLRELARARHTTLFSVLLAAFHLHLGRSTGQPELAVASMFANRSRPETRDTVGLLAHMVLLRARLDRAATFADLVRHTHGTVIGAFAHQELPLQMLPGDVLDGGGAALEDVVFNVMAEFDQQQSAGGVRFGLLLPEEIGGRFRFELAVAPIGGDRLRALLFHTEERLDSASARTFLRGYARLLGAVAARPEAPLAELRQPLSTGA